MRNIRQKPDSQIIYSINSTISRSSPGKMKFKVYVKSLPRFTTSCIVIAILLPCLGSSMMDHEFCGHSLKINENIFGARDKRSIEYELQRGAQRQGTEPQISVNQQEDQIVIDETSFGKVNQETNIKATENRIGCTKSTSHFGSQSLENKLGSQARSTDDCDVKTIETAVFIDQALENKFNGQSNGLVELNKLVLTIMNQVQNLFSYSSIKVPIKIKLVLVEHLRDGERLGLSTPNPEKGDIDLYLSSFCNWQYNRLERDKRLWWDHAILLSGLDLYKATPGKNHSGVLGLAWVGGMCKGNYSCTINEVTNLESAFVIAHEIGHSLGIMHDGQRNTCDPNGFIMSERTGAGKVHWSRCSNNYLNESFSKLLLNCLDNEQNANIDPLYDLSKLRSPGQVYSINDQCRLAFGNNYTSFVTRQQPFNSVCRELWCVSGSWAKAAHPALEGSFCGDQDRVCREGKCLRQ